MSKILKPFIPLLLLIITTSCIGTEPLYAPKRGFFENRPQTYNASYQVAWDAAIQAVEELKWDINVPDMEKGKIKLMTSYVYNSGFEEYTRIYVEPTNEQIKKSRVRPYLRKIAYYRQDTVFFPMFVNEDLTLVVKGVNDWETEVYVKYRVRPYYNYKVGYNGTLKSKGTIEKKLYKRIGEILEGDTMAAN